MAGETTITTLAGLQDILLAQSVAKFQTRSTLFNAVYTQAAQNETTVRFNTEAVPYTAALQATEGGAVAIEAVTIGAQDATLGTYPSLATVSKLSWPSPGAVNSVTNTLAGKLARTTDTLLTKLFTSASFSSASLSSSLSASITLDYIFDASAHLDAEGYIGEKILVLHPKSWIKVAKEILSLAGGSYNVGAEILRTGYIASVAGISIYVSPWVGTVLAAGATYAYNNLMFIREAIGLGYRDPLIDITWAPNLRYNTMDVLGVSYQVVKVLTANAGTRLEDTTS